MSERMMGAFLSWCDAQAQPERSCWPPSMSYVAPVSAVLAMMWTASAAMSAGPTARPIARVARSSSRRASELIAEERRRQGCVDEAGGDQVDANRCHLERQAGREGREGDPRRRGDPDTDVAGPRAAHEQKRASRRTLSAAGRGAPHLNHGGAAGGRGAPPEALPARGGGE